MVCRQPCASVRRARAASICARSWARRAKFRVGHAGWAQRRVDALDLPVARRNGERHCAARAAGVGQSESRRRGRVAIEAGEEAPVRGQRQRHAVEVHRHGARQGQAPQPATL
jgi:hypothetical protein